MVATDIVSTIINSITEFISTWKLELLSFAGFGLIIYYIIKQKNLMEKGEKQ